MTTTTSNKQNLPSPAELHATLDALAEIGSTIDAIEMELRSTADLSEADVGRLLFFALETQGMAQSVIGDAKGLAERIMVIRREASYGEEAAA